MAQSGHRDGAEQRPLLGVKRTWIKRVVMSAFDPKRTSAICFCCDAQARSMMCYGLVLGVRGRP